MRPHLPKTRPVKSVEALGAYAASHGCCAACGADWRPLHIHHIIGGRGGRSDEPCNFLRLCFHPCHALAEGLDVRGPSMKKWITAKEAAARGDVGLRNMLMNTEKQGMAINVPGCLLPKLPLGVQLSIKLRLGELSAADRERLAVLHGRNLPDLEEIPAFFVDQWKRNRPEFNGDKR